MCGRNVSIVTAVLALGCGRVSFDTAGRDGGVGDAGGTDASFDGGIAPDAGMEMDGGESDATLGSFAARRIDELSSPLVREDDPTSTADGLELYFNRDDTVNQSIWVSTRATVGEPWSPPGIVAELESAADDSNPEVSADGLTMWLCSRRVSEFALFVSTRGSRADPWRTPELVSELRSGAVNCGAVETDAGRRIVYAHKLGGTTPYVLVEATRSARGATWNAGVEIEELLLGGNTDGPFPTPDGLRVYFASDHAEIGNPEIYYADRPSLDLPFGAPVRIDELATPGMESDPWLSPDGRQLFFERDGDLWEATR